MRKGPIHQENITITNIYGPSNKAPKYMKPKMTKWKENISCGEEIFL